VIDVAAYEIPCKYCHHRAYRHFVSIVDDGNEICLDCVRDPGTQNLNNWHHFSPDNLSYIEDLAKEKKLI
jgi:hypothetical protein